MAVLCELCLPYSKVDGKFISYKSEKVSEEIKYTVDNYIGNSMLPDDVTVIDVRFDSMLFF